MLGKPKKCTKCGIKKTTPKSIQWANKSKEYKRDLNDWISLCSKCHFRYDGQHLRIRDYHGRYI